MNWIHFVSLCCLLLKVTIIETRVRRSRFANVTKNGKTVKTNPAQTTIS